MALVAGIWGVIGFKIIRAANPSPKPMAQTPVQKSFVPQQAKQRDTFSIAANYRDPFLGTLQRPRKTKQTSPKKVRKKVPEKNISYTGFIAGNNSAENVFFVTVDGQQRMMELNDTFNGVKLLRGSKSEIRVLCLGRTKNIGLQQ